MLLRSTKISTKGLTVYHFSAKNSNKHLFLGACVHVVGNFAAIVVI